MVHHILQYSPVNLHEVSFKIILWLFAFCQQQCDKQGKTPLQCQYLSAESKSVTNMWFLASDGTIIPDHRGTVILGATMLIIEYKNNNWKSLYLSSVTLPLSLHNLPHASQKWLALHKHLISPQVFWWGPCCSSFYFFVLSYYVSLCSEFSVAMSVTISVHMISSNLPPVVCRRAHVLFTLFVFVCI
jgi:hypothetical protein